MSIPATLALILAVAIPVELFRAYRLDDRLVARWAAERGLELTSENRAMVAQYVRRARLFRIWGGVVGVLMPTAIDLAVKQRVQVLGFGTDGQNAPLAFGSIFIGY